MINKKIKGVIAVAMATIVAITGFGLNNVFSSNADESNKVKYERDNHLGLDAKGDLVITRNELGNTSMGKENAWTIFIYMCGSDLESGVGAATNDIAELIEASANENVNFVIQTGGACEWQKYGIDSNKIQRYVVKEDKIELIETLPNASMAESSTLESFVKWGVDNYASEHMGMIYWNHGGGSIYGACSDENYDGMLTLSEFEKAMSGATKNMTDKFDFVGFDACLMASIEVANTFVPYAEFMIASEESESGEGWNYTALANKLAENPDCDVVDLGKTIIDSFMQTNIENCTDDIATLSMTDLSKIDGILVQFNKVAKKMYEMSKTKEDMTIFTRLAKAAENYSEGYGFDMIDFTDYMLNIADLIPEAEDVASLMEEAIVYEQHGEVFQDTKGLTFYYCYGNMSMSDMNILRNISISPYLLNFIEKLAYGALNNSSLDGFVSNNWDKNEEYYYDDNYDFVKYEFQSMLDYSEVLCNDAYFQKASFDEVWYDWFELDEMDNVDELELVENDETDNENMEEFDNYINEEDILFVEGEEIEEDTVKIDLEISERIDLNGVTLTNKLSAKELKTVAQANYKLVVDNGTTMNVLGSLGTIEDETTYTGKWFALADGSLIAADKINEGNGLTMYQANVLMDGNETYIYFVADKNQNVLVLGTCGAMDKETKSASRIIPELKDGAKIAPIYTNINYTTGKVSKTIGKEITVSGKAIQSIEFNNNSFALQTIDAFGQASYSIPTK